MADPRFRSQLLAGPPARDPPAVVGRLLAVQAQDPRAARLAIRARSQGLGASDVDRALTEERSLVVAYLNRGTLHLVRSEDYPWLQALLGPRLVKESLRRIGQEGLTQDDGERAAAIMERALADEGPLTRSELGERFTAAGIRLEGQALMHLLRLVCVRGIAVRGPMAGRDHAYALVRDWLGEPPSVDRETALAELARRYLAGHGPGDDRDLARWTGLGLRDARAGLRACGPARALAAAPEPAPKLLGGFDPVLFGWVSREWVLDGLSGLITLNGIFKAFALAGGRAVGTWAAVAEDPAFDAERSDVERFLAA